MKDLINQALELINAEFNPRIKNNQLLVDLKGQGTLTFFQEEKNQKSITDNIHWFTPAELNDYLIKCDEFFSKFRPLRINDFLKLENKKIEFTYTDHDNGSISGVGVVKSITKIDDYSYSVKMNILSGEDIHSIYIHESNGYVMSGDDSDEVLFNVFS